MNCYLFGYWRGEVMLNMRLSVMVQYVSIPIKWRKIANLVIAVLDNLQWDVIHKHTKNEINACLRMWEFIIWICYTKHYKTVPIFCKNRYNRLAWHTARDYSMGYFVTRCRIRTNSLVPIPTDTTLQGKDSDVYIGRRCET